LMFVDSIMSFFSSRITRWDRGIEAYNITAEDLIHFPHIQNSDNFYWPTKKSLFPLLLGNKKYITDREIRSFRDLAKNSKFNKAKWTNFYKHILINEGLVKDSLKKCFDDTISRDRAQISLVTQALIARQARLRAVLFSVQEFREFVCEMSDDDKRALIHDIGASSPQDFESKMQLYQTFCTSPQGYEEGDTPLHIAIKLGDYRYEETMDIFEEFLHSKNKAGKSPFDVAYALAETQKQGTRPTDIRQDAQWTMKHLLERGAKITRQIDKEKILSYKFKTNYINRAEDAQHYAELKDTLRDIGEDHSFCLKFKKNLAIECIEGFIKKNQDNPNLKKILIRLREDVNGTSSDSESAGLQFIRQLRSKLWIIRQIRKLFGVSSTLAEIRSIINTELNQINAKDPHCFSFFSCCNSSKLDGDAEPGLGQDDPTHAPT